jgi:hypothetical protein
MKEEQVNRYLKYYSVTPPYLDDYELKYFDCLFQSNEEFIRSCTNEELYQKYGLTRYLHFIIYSIRKLSN